MVETHPQSRRSLIPGTWSSLLILAGLILIGMAAGSIAGVLLISSIWGDAGILTEISTLDQAPAYSAENWYKIIILQAVGHLFTFLIPSLFYWKLIERKAMGAFCLQSRDSYRDLVPIFFLTIVLMPFTGLVAEWNESMILPDSLSGLENWMKNSETTLARLTEFLLSFHNIPELIIAIIVIAVIPAIGEEVLFRGILQRKLAEHWANVHLGIWASAFLFSAIHFQFYGFLPRLFLGAMFGYLYFWTGRLSMAIFAHFINNAVTVLLMWMYRQQMINLDISSSQAIPLWMGAASLVVSVWLLRVVYNTSSEPSNH
ncbi:MAG: hypothetical protein ABS46_13610 [Cytophagaceae bacterium SCN 52-12]|nr:MAG: hypothetical protein ABS46_13610 [Cytophagaceae bacterium SCN 52-12]